MKMMIDGQPFLSGTPKEMAEYMVAFSNARRNNGHDNKSKGAIDNAPTPNVNPNDVLNDLGQFFGGMINHEPNDQNN